MFVDVFVVVVVVVGVVVVVVVGVVVVVVMGVGVEGGVVNTVTRRVSRSSYHPRTPQDPLRPPALWTSALRGETSPHQRSVLVCVRLLCQCSSTTNA